jgi:hypothetical protein
MTPDDFADDAWEHWFRAWRGIFMFASSVCLLVSLFLLFISLHLAWASERFVHSVETWKPIKPKCFDTGKDRSESPVTNPEAPQSLRH